MIDIVTNERLIARYQKALIQRLKSICEQKISCKIGYKGKSKNATFFYSSKYDFWFVTQRSTNRYWNAFGIGKPQVNKQNSIIVEINTPYSGVNRSTGGAFGQTPNKEILVLHRGKIGGGKIGIGKQLFFDQIEKDELITANDDGVETEFCLIGSITSKYFFKQLSTSIANVHRMKYFLPKSEQDFSELNNFKFSNEHFGKIEIDNKGKRIINRVHGIVVNSLANQLEGKGLSIGKDRNRDLFIHKNKKITTLFEIKTNSSPQSLYAAVGQLLIYSIPIKTKVNLVIVVPDKLTKIVSERLNKFGIDILYYSWNNDEPIFDESDSLF